MTSYRTWGWFSALLFSLVLLVGAGLVAQAEPTAPAAPPLRTRPAPQRPDPALPPVVLPTIEVRPEPEDQGGRAA